MTPPTAQGQPVRMRRSIWISGLVQGVGFRPFVYRLAQRLGVCGSVCNTGAGVCIEAEGSVAVLDQFVHGLREQAPPLARLDTLEVSPDYPVPHARDAAENAVENAVKDLDSGARGGSSGTFVILASTGDEQGGQDGKSEQGGHGMPATHTAASGVTAGGRVLISPDVAPCADCLAEMRDPAHRRYRYPFTNCTNCGPRFTITRAIPYDRATTSMACFPLCPDCAREYGDPADRRFHAQPNACPVCGPVVHAYAASGAELATGPTALDMAASALRQGQIVAVKGVGGFLLACDAYKSKAIHELRIRKHRPHKPLAVMAGDVETARMLVEVDEDTAACLLSAARPIVLCPRRERREGQAGLDAWDEPGLPKAVWAALAPDSDELGLMLPSTPLHEALFARLRAAGEAHPLLVMTSGNAPGEPLCLGNREALHKLAAYADVLLTHNRDIVTRVDDSVLRLLDVPELPAETALIDVARTSEAGHTGEAGEVSTTASRVQMLRRARGFVPSPLRLTCDGTPLLAWGADLKNTVCAVRGDQAFVGQHVGDVEHPASQAFMRESARHLLEVLRLRPAAMVCDAHPDSFARLAAEEAAVAAGVPLYTVQHHRAHVYSVLAEHGSMEPALGLALDGAGYGEDGTVWGGELLAVYPETPDADVRVGRLRPFPLPGGDAAVHEIWRIAAGLLEETGMEAGQRDSMPSSPVSSVPLALPVSPVPPVPPVPWSDVVPPAHAQAVTASVAASVIAIVRAGLAPRTSSCGRLFDAVSALLGLGNVRTYEGQGAIRLEQCAALRVPQALELAAQKKGAALRGLGQAAQGGSTASCDPLLARTGDLWELDSHALFARVVVGRAQGVPACALSRNFHLELASALASMAAQEAAARGIRRVALGGGVLHNRIMAALLVWQLKQYGLVPLMATHMPPGDGGLSLGQAWWLRCRIASDA